MPRRNEAAAVVLIRGVGDEREVLLVHPGGPFFAHKDAGAWSLPKGLLERDEDPLVAAKREFAEETGHPAPEGEYVDCGEVSLKSGKVVHAWAVRGDLDAASIKSNLVELEHPPGSGRVITFPEVDRACWASLARARVLLNAAQVPLVERALTRTA
jgi:predicted NUDIX family NTP pyrophosphohydrolase